jgi:histidinol-phosphate aminotransferase
MKPSDKNAQSAPGAAPSIPDHVLRLTPYEPGKPIEEVERELGLTDVVKLASNENPLGPSPAALEAAQAVLGDVHRYPEGGAVMLAERLAERLGVSLEQLAFGTGSNEVIDLLIRTFVRAGEPVVMSADAFVVYALITKSFAGKVVQVPARGYHHDLEAIRSVVTDETKMVFLANPNNPTGTIFGYDEWRAFMSDMPSHVVVVVDQAYYEYVDDDTYPEVLDELDRYPGLVVLRTFSKIYGLAGLRLGYGIGSREIMQALARVRQPFNTNLVAQAAALAALDDEEHVARSRALVARGRMLFGTELDRLGVAWVPSHANFVLARVGEGAQVTRKMLELGVIVRPMDGYGFPDHVRITFGTDEENARCLEVLARVLAERL